MTDKEILKENTQLPKNVLGFVVYFIKRYKFAIIIALLITFFRNEGSLFLSKLFKSSFLIESS